MAIKEKNYVTDDIWVAVEATEEGSGEPIPDAIQVRIWVRRPDGTLLGDKNFSSGVEHVGEGVYRASFKVNAKGWHEMRATVTGPDTRDKNKFGKFYVYAL